jgi:hypothetical protein
MKNSYGRLMGEARQPQKRRRNALRRKKIKKKQQQKMFSLCHRLARRR